MILKRPTIPVTVIGGFLGAGKTTFVNHLLRQTRERIAVLVNDFGAVNVDAALIASHDGTTMSLTNGCVCCSIGGGFLETLGAVLDGGAAFDRIVIEASGVGDPWRIAEIALVEPALRLDGVVVLADASRIVSLLADSRVGDTVRGQFAQCDVVLLNKADLVDADGMTAARDAIAALREGVRIIACSQTALPELADLGSGTPRGRFRADSPATDDRAHEDRFRRWFYRREGSFDRFRLELALLSLPPQVLRLKGTCRLAGDGDPVILQWVPGSWSFTPADSPADSGIELVGVGAADLPPSSELDALLDAALLP